MLILVVSKRGVKWSPQPRSAPLRAVESPTMKRVGRVGFGGLSSGMLDWGGVMGVGPGVPVWAWRVAEIKIRSSRKVLASVVLALRFGAGFTVVMWYPLPPPYFAQNIQNIVLK